MSTTMSKFVARWNSAGVAHEVSTDESEVTFSSAFRNGSEKHMAALTPMLDKFPSDKPGKETEASMTVSRPVYRKLDSLTIPLDATPKISCNELRFEVVIP